MAADVVTRLRAAHAKAERLARDASGGTVVGNYGNWSPSPAGDEWAMNLSADDDLELIVALRPGLPRPPDVMSGMWGAVISYVPDDSDPNTDIPLPQLRHAALHDPKAVLRRIKADRKTLADYELTVRIRDEAAQRIKDAGDSPDSTDLDTWDRAQREAAILVDVVHNMAEGWGL